MMRAKKAVKNFIFWVSVSIVVNFIILFDIYSEIPEEVNKF